MQVSLVSGQEGIRAGDSTYGGTVLESWSWGAALFICKVAEVPPKVLAVFSVRVLYVEAGKAVLHFIEGIPAYFQGDAPVAENAQIFQKV